MSYFSEDYRSARAKIIDKASAQAGWAHIAYEHTEKGVDGRTLFVDVFRRGSETPRRILSICSGTHGAEGFAGSALQSQFVDDAPNLPDDTAVFLIHAVNPYGFSHMRRVTEDNVDLNRNFIDFDGVVPENEKYSEIYHLLNPSELPEERIDALLGDILALRETMDYLSFFKAVSGGQYQYSEGVQFGGQAPTWSRRTMETIWDKHFNGAELVVHVDIHTGLGPKGVGVMMMAANPDEPHKQITEGWFGEMMVTPRPVGQADTIIAGYLNGGLEQALPEAWVMPMTLEFGTEPGESVLRAMIEDNWLEFHGAGDESQAAEIKARVRAAFYPDCPDWRAGVLERGREVFQQALDGMSALDLKEEKDA